MSMRKRLLLVLIVMLALGAGTSLAGMFGNEQIKGSGNVQTEDRSIGDFTSVSLSGSPDLYITVGGAPSLSIKGEDNILALIRTEVQGDTLVIDSEKSWSSMESIIIRVTVPDLQSAQLMGSGDIDIQGLSGDRFSVSLQGSGDVRAAGTVRELSADVQGSGDIHLYDLDAMDADVSVVGSGDVRVRVTGNLDASVTGSGDIRYKGNPQVKSKVHGSGDIDPD